MFLISVIRRSVCRPTLVQSPTVTGHGLRGAVVGWYLPVLVVDEKMLSRDGVRVVMLRRVAVSKAAGGRGRFSDLLPNMVGSTNAARKEILQNGCSVATIAKFK